MSSRRNFLSSTLCGLFAAQGLDVGQPELAPGSDLAKLVKLIDLHGPKAVGEQILAQSGRIDVAEINRHFNRVQRHWRAAKRRERHAGNETLYRGPVEIWQTFCTRLAVSEVTRHKVYVGDSSSDLEITGIGVPGTSETRSVAIPAGSRILFDGRHGLEHQHWASEVVQLHDGLIRLHLWQGRTAYEPDPDRQPPFLRGGAYETQSQSRPAVGLLGLPL